MEFFNTAVLIVSILLSHQALASQPKFPNLYDVTRSGCHISKKTSGMRRSEKHHA